MASVPTREKKSGTESVEIESPESSALLEHLSSEIEEMVADFDMLRNRIRSSMGPSVFRGLVGLPRELAFAPTDVVDTGNAYEVKVDLPGIPKEKIEIAVTGQTLDVRAQAVRAREQEGRNYIFRERTERGFHRRLEYPSAVLGDKAEAKLESGVLTISVPKAKPAEGHRVTVA